MAKKKRNMSAAARRRISEAQKKRWAAYRSGKGPSMKKRRGRPRKASPSDNPYLNMTIEQLVTAKSQLDAAWKEVRSLVR